MDAPRRFQRKEDFRVREESEAGEMVFYSGVVRDSRRIEMGDFSADSFLEDYRLGAGGAAGTLQMGDVVRVIGFRKSDNSIWNAVVDHVFLCGVFRCSCLVMLASLPS